MPDPSFFGNDPAVQGTEPIDRTPDSGQREPAADDDRRRGGRAPDRPESTPETPEDDRGDRR